ncbi:hypothetical protein D3C86_1378020 [compost metagenome]
MLLTDQAHAPRFVHHPAHGVDVQRRGVGRVAIRAQGGHQRDDIFGLQLMPGDLLDIHVFETQAVCRVLQDVAHGQLAGRGQSRQVQGQRIDFWRRGNNSG